MVIAPYSGNAEFYTYKFIPPTPRDTREIRIELDYSSCDAPLYLLQLYSILAP